MVKQWQVKLISARTNDFVLTTDPAVSAFAARKAARRSIGEVTSQNERQTARETETCNDPMEEFKPPRKKQKRSNEYRNRSLRQPQQTDGSVDVSGGSVKDGAKAIEDNSESESASYTERETLAQSIAVIYKLSTFDLSRSKVLDETDTKWTVRLHPNDVSG